MPGINYDQMDTGKQRSAARLIAIVGGVALVVVVIMFIIR
jgi:hypothetical protein